MHKGIAVFITGLSGTGKTTMVRAFRDRSLDGWVIADFDEGPEPVPADRVDHLAWRTRQTAWCIQEALRNAERGMKTAVFGLSLYPSALRQLPGAEVLQLHFAVLHAPHETRKARIMERGTPNAWQGVQDWYEEFEREMKDANAKVFDTEHNTAEKIQAEIGEWLMSLS